jgi:hypothetical protein
VVHQDQGGQCTFTDPAKGIAGAQTDCLWRTRNQIAQEIRVFCDPEQYGKPEIWGWCAGYDFVALCQLFNTMMELPTGFPHYIRDLQYLLDMRGITDDMLPPQGDRVHNALADARYIKQLWGSLIAPPFWSVQNSDRDFVGTWHHNELLLKGDPRLDASGAVKSFDLSVAIDNTPIFRKQLSPVEGQIERETKQ